MSRPTLEVADIVRASGHRFWEHYGSHLACSIAKCSMPSSAAALRPWALIVISAPAADIRLSLTTHAVIGTAPDVRGTPALVGSPSARLSCCPSLTSTSSSRYRTNSPLWPCRTSGCFTICSSEPVRRRCSNWPVIQCIWEQR